MYHVQDSVCPLIIFSSDTVTLTNSLAVKHHFFLSVLIQQTDNLVSRYTG